MVYPGINYHKILDPTSLYHAHVRTPSFIPRRRRRRRRRRCHSLIVSAALAAAAVGIGLVPQV